ncbi:phage minor head protein [Breoghania sp.]|uniref:phage head morphogenesis protein n=1 Tax=Breoghania sp. TaxID=2065378 RepID=UPI0029CA6BA1|nr:phage minor head protein [Breoghania sp.]
MADERDDIPDQFKTASPEVLRYFGEKQSRPTFDWRDIAPHEHAYAFTVAKTAGFDVLADLRAAVDDAITNRVPFETFRGQLEPILRKKGWWGRRFATDPKDGRPAIVQLGSARRLRTIYWANVRTAHAAGEWERTQRNKRFLPFLVYTLSTAERRRLEHRSWVGIILPVDHPFWRTHYPPNGWGCRCGVRQISRAEAERLGYDPEAGGPQIVTRSWRNTRTGQTVQVPVGIDPGWDTNPGATRGRNMAELFGGAIDNLPTAARSAAVADLVASPGFKLLVERSAEVGLKRAAAVKALRAEGLTGAQIVERFGTELPYPLTRFPVGVAPARFGDDYWPVMIDAATIGHSADHRRTPDTSVWSNIGDILKRARAKRDGDVVRLHDAETKLFIVLELMPAKKVWRIRTLFKAQRASYFGRQSGRTLD